MKLHRVTKEEYDHFIESGKWDYNFFNQDCWYDPQLYMVGEYASPYQLVAMCLYIYTDPPQYFVAKKRDIAIGRLLTKYGLRRKR